MGSYTFSLPVRGILHLKLLPVVRTFPLLGSRLNVPPEQKELFTNIKCPLHMLQRPSLHSSGHNFVEVNQQEIICNSSLRASRRYHLKLLSCTFCTLNSSTKFIPLVNIFFVKLKDFEVFQVKLLQF